MSILSGLTSEHAFDRLIHEAKATIAEWYSVNIVNKLKTQPANKVQTFSRFFCARNIFFIRISLIFLIIGSSDIENNVVYSLVFIYILLLVYTIFLEIWQKRKREELEQLKYVKALKEIENIEKSKPSKFLYHSTLEAVTDDLTIYQTCIRDGIVIEVPRLLLVKGDVLVFRPGQVSSCDCETFDGRIVAEGERIEWKMENDKKTGAVKPLEPIYAHVTSFPIKTHLETLLSTEEPSLQFDHTIQYIIHRIFEKFLVPAIFLSSLFITIIRFFYSDNESLFGTRFSFAVPSLTILPILTIQLPLLLNFIKFRNNLDVVKFLKISAKFYTFKDLVSIFARLTGASFIDKKGILSSVHPSIEKVVFAKKVGENIENPVTNLHLEVLNLSSEQNSSNPSKWNLVMEDPNWQTFTSNLLPLSYNLLLNSCKQSEDFHRFLDHLSVVTRDVPRTIATANRRCMCQLPSIIGLTDKSFEQFSNKTPTFLGIYKRQPGDAPLPGLTKHRTPLEMAFCTIYEDSKSLHSHISCQGTANLVLDACTHIWDGTNVIPMTKKVIGSVKDFYQRNSMTGHCLAVSYRPIFSKIDKSIEGKFIEVPLNREPIHLDDSIPRSHSYDSLKSVEFVARKKLKTAEEVIDECFTGNILCGLIVLHYEAIPQAVSVIEKLDAICVRPVYFSKENELRSRVFAEKLGIEAGWNCHISLADEELITERPNVAHEQFVDQKPKKSRFWKRFALSDSHLESLDCESILRGSPSIRKMSLISSGKMGPIPNNARLPAGVKNVRPHLEEVDNVPLLVGLFTDSTKTAVEEMLDIMQENGEVVMVVGSSRSVNNTLLYAKSNVSICVDDILEPACRLDERVIESNVNEIASRLVALATDFRLNHEMLTNLPSLIKCCRHRMSSVRHSLHFYFLSSLLISLIILISTCCFLPIIFTHSQVLLSTLLHIPILFIGTLFTEFRPNHNIIRIAPKNCFEMSKAEKHRAITTFLIQFAPTAFYINTLYFFMLISNSNLMCSFSDISCIFNTDLSANHNSTIDDEIGAVSLSTDTLRHIMGLQLTTCLCVLSSAFVYGLSSFWVYVPLKCIYWNISVVICLVSQIAFSCFHRIHLFDLFSLVPLIFLLAWLIIIAIINELIKIRRIRQFTRDQRRTKFDFDTKLGMNSPI